MFLIKNRNSQFGGKNRKSSSIILGAGPYKQKMKIF
jgi:hypothetical protein